MGGLFDDIFDDGDFEIASEEVIDDSKDEFDDDWGAGAGPGATWDTGRKPDVWNADEPWTTASDDCDDDCDPTADCDSCKGNSSSTMDDFFN